MSALEAFEASSQPQHASLRAPVHTVTTSVWQAMKSSVHSWHCHASHHIPCAHKPQTHPRITAVGTAARLLAYSDAAALSSAAASSDAQLQSTAAEIPSQASAAPSKALQRFDTPSATPAAAHTSAPAGQQGRQLSARAIAATRVLALTAWLSALSFVIWNAGEPALTAGTALLAFITAARFIPAPSLFPLQPIPQAQANIVVATALLAPTIGTLTQLAGVTVRWAGHLASQGSMADVARVALADVERVCGTREAQLLSLCVMYTCTWLLPVMQLVEKTTQGGYKQPQWQALGLACVRCAVLATWLGLGHGTHTLTWIAVLVLALFTCCLSIAGGFILGLF